MIDSPNTKMGKETSDEANQNEEAAKTYQAYTPPVGHLNTIWLGFFSFSFHRFLSSRSPEIVEIILGETDQYKSSDTDTGFTVFLTTHVAFSNVEYSTESRRGKLLTVQVEDDFLVDLVGNVSDLIPSIKPNPEFWVIWKKSGCSRLFRAVNL